MSIDKETRALAEGLMQQLSYQNTHLSEIAEKLATGVMNHVLESGSRLFDSTGQITFQWNSTCGSIEIYNASASRTITVCAGGPSGEPTSGTGVHKIPPGTLRTVNMMSRIVTVYGASTDTFGVQAFTVAALPNPGGRILAVDGGTA